MGYAGVACKCPVCGKKFYGQSFHIYKMKSQGKQPSCSRECDRERRHKDSRDAKWKAEQLKFLSK